MCESGDWNFVTISSSLLMVQTNSPAQMVCAIFAKWLARYFQPGRKYKGKSAAHEHELCSPKNCDREEITTSSSHRCACTHRMHDLVLDSYAWLQRCWV